MCNGTSRPSLSVAIVHHPCINRLGQEICSTISEHDVFDASRLSLTYNVNIYVVNPKPAQRELCMRLLSHGTDSNTRASARGLFTKTSYAADLETVIQQLTTEHGAAPFVVATSAKSSNGDVSFASVREHMQQGRHLLLLVGKAWGLSSSVLDAADARLTPIDSGSGYNHLSVRSALAILIDRLCAR